MEVSESFYIALPSPPRDTGLPPIGAITQYEGRKVRIEYWCTPAYTSAALLCGIRFMDTMETAMVVPTQELIDGVRA